MDSHRHGPDGISEVEEVGSSIDCQTGTISRGGQPENLHLLPQEKA